MKKTLSKAMLKFEVEIASDIALLNEFVEKINSCRPFWAEKFETQKF
jgi:hypothetical protein